MRVCTFVRNLVGGRGLRYRIAAVQFRLQKSKELIGCRSRVIRHTHWARPNDRLRPTGSASSNVDGTPGTLYLRGHDDAFAVSRTRLDPSLRTGVERRRTPRSSRSGHAI